MKMSKDATLHEKTVQKVARGEVSKPKRKRAAPTKRATTTRHIRVDGRVWKVACELAAGDLTRLEVISAEEVIVR